MIPFEPYKFIKSPDIPPQKDQLHHYTNADGLFGIIDNEELWASKIQFLNDTSEFLHFIDITKNEINLKKAEPSVTKDQTSFYEIAEESLDNIIQINAFICSFSEEPDKLSQWRGYGGFSIGFNFDKLKSSISQNFYLKRCIYDPVEQRKKCVELLDYFENRYNLFKVKLPPVDREGALKATLQQFNENISLMGLFMKHKSFEEEHEWRLIRYNSSIDSAMGMKFRPRNNKIIPYCSIDLKNEPDLMIDNILIGPNGQKNLINHSLDLFLRNKNLKIKLEHSKSPYMI